MLATLAISGAMIIYKKSFKNSKSNMPEKLRKEFENHTEGIAIINKQRKAVFMNGNFKGLLDSTNEADALQELLRLRKFESYSERVRRGFMQEIRNEKGGHQPFTRQQSIRQKSDGNPRSLMRLKSLKKSHETQSMAAVTFKESVEFNKSPVLKNNHIDLESRQGLTGTTQPYTKSITRRLFSRWSSKKNTAPQRNKIELEDITMPHDDSVEAQLDAMFLEIEAQETASKSHSSVFNESRSNWWSHYFKDSELPSKNYLATEGSDMKDLKAKKANFVYRTALGELKLLKIKLIPFQKNKASPGVLINIDDVTLQTRLQEALEINEQKDKLLSFVAHEFRTPLNCTLSLLEVLKGSISFALSEQFLDPVLNSSKMLQNLVNDILDFSQIKAKKLKVSIVPCNIKKAVDEVVEMLKLQATALGINFQVNWDQNIPRIIHTDPNRFKQILTNLLANAFKFTHGGSVTIKATSVEYTVTKIEIIDTGIGISKENLEKLFQEFGKIQESAHLNPSGVGLGLVISKLLSTELGPDSTGLTVESEEGVGTTFSFLLHSKGGEYFKSNFMSKTLDLETSDDEERERPEELLNRMKTQYGVIDQATKPISYQEILVTNTQATEESPKSSLLVHQRGNILEMKANLVNSKKKNSESFNSAKSKQFSKFASMVKSSNVISHTNPNDVAAKFGTLSQGCNMPKKGLPLYPNSNSGSARRRANKSFHRSHKSLVSGDMTYTENNPHLEFSFLVENLNDICECPKVLIVDDNAFNLTALTLVLRNLGIDTATAVNGEMAIQKVILNQDHNMRCKNFSIIFMDVEMPILNGFETTKILKKKMLEGDITFIPIIGVTGHNAQDKKVECLRSGMNDMISKPVSTLTLQETIMKWVDINGFN